MRTTCLILLIAGLCLATLLMGCGDNNPAIPSDAISIGNKTSQTHLWGYYDVVIGIENQTVEAVLNRNAMFTLNVVDFINSDIVTNLSFYINDVWVGSDYIDVDIDVSITHPFPGLPEFYGYDVRGVFMSDGSATLGYNSDLHYPVFGTDQFMLTDQIDGFGGPDGYTRWFNKPEFFNPGLFGYTQGNLAPPDFDGDATLNAYKYFADGLGENENLWDWLNNNASQYGVFSAGSTNKRNYYLRFPNTKGLNFGYAVLANWEGVESQYHPSNASEVVTAEMNTIASDINFNPPNIECGNLVLDLSLAGYGKQPSTIYIEADELFATLQTIDPLTTVIGGGATYSTYHIDIPVDNVSSAGPKEFWVIAEYSNEDYSNEFGISNNASGSLSAFFRGTVLVGTESCDSPNQDPVCDIQVITPMPYIGWSALIEFDASASFDPDNDPLSFEWDFNNDGIFGDTYDTGTDANPQKMFVGIYVDDVCVKVTDGQGGEAICCVAVDIHAYQSKNIPLRSGVEARDIAIVGSTGDVLILYNDGQVWKYVEPYTYGSTFTGVLFYGTGLSYLWYIEASANGDSLVNNGTSGGPFASQSWYADGTLANNHNASLNNNTWNSDGWCPTAGSWNGRHCFWYKTYFVPPQDTSAIGYILPDYGSGSGILFTEGLGTDYINHNYLVGTEVDSNGYVYCVEKGPEYRVERKNYQLKLQDGPYWGGFGNTSPNFNDPRDITRDSNPSNTIYVLDELSNGNPAIKKFTWDGTPSGTFGDTDTISSTPLRIEGSQRTFPTTSENLMFILHGNSTDGYFVSIFTPAELT